MKVTVCLYGFYRQVGGASSVELDVGEAADVREMVSSLREALPSLRDYLDRADTDEELRRRAVFLRGTRMLRVGDVLQDGDVVKMVAPLMGGAPG